MTGYIVDEMNSRRPEKVWDKKTRQAFPRTPPGRLPKSPRRVKNDTFPGLA